MLDQLFNIVKQFGQDTVVNNQDVPNEHNQEVMADATNTIAGGFQNIMAGGGFQNILDLFKGNKASGSGARASGLLKNPIVIMMVGYFIKKLVSKYRMSPSSASNVATNLIPNSVNGLIQQTNDPDNSNVTLDRLVASLTGGGNTQEEQTGGGGSQLQDILDKLTGGDNTNGKTETGNSSFNIQDIISSLTQKSQNNFQSPDKASGGLIDIIKGFIR